MFAVFARAGKAHSTDGEDSTRPEPQRAKIYVAAKHRYQEAVYVQRYGKGEFWALLPDASCCQPDGGDECKQSRQTDDSLLGGYLKNDVVRVAWLLRTVIGNWPASQTHSEQGFCGEVRERGAVEVQALFGRAARIAGSADK